MARELFWSEMPSTIGLVMTSSSPPPMLVTTYAKMSAGKIGIHSGSSPSINSPAAHKMWAATALTRKPILGTKRDAAKSVRICRTKPRLTSKPILSSASENRVLKMTNSSGARQQTAACVTEAR